MKAKLNKTLLFRCVSLHHATPQGYQLLKAILTADIIHPDRDMWSLFLPNLSPPTADAVEFLLSILQKLSIPEQFRPSVLTTANYSSVQYPLRSQLIDWLFPSSEAISGSSLSNLSSDINPESIAHVLILLTIKNQSSLENHGNNSDIVSTVTDLENTYVQTSCEFPVANKCFRCKLSKQTQDEILHLPILLKKIEEMIEEEMTCFVDTTDILPKHIDSAISMTCLISKLIYWLLNYNVVTCETLLTMNIVNLLKIVYKQLSVFMAEIYQKEGTPASMNTLRTLQVILEIGNSNDTANIQASIDTANIQASRLIRCLFPAKIVDQLLTMASNKVDK